MASKKKEADYVAYREEELQTDGPDDGLGVYVAPESQTGYQAEGAAKQLNIVQLAIVIVVFGIGLVLAIIGIVFLFINDGDYMKYTIWILPISFVFFVASVVLLGVFMFPHKLKRFYQWK